MSHQYFDDNSDLPMNRMNHSFLFQGEPFQFTTDSGVFSKEGVDFGTELLLESAISFDLKGELLDLGCGYGVIGIVLKRFFPNLKVTCSDINPRALELTEINQEQNQCEVEVVVSGGFDRITQSFDAIITNPPIRVGKQILYRLFEDSYRHLNNQGVFLAVVRRKQGAESAQKELRSIFGNCDVLEKKKGYWILCSIRTN